MQRFKPEKVPDSAEDDRQLPQTQGLDVQRTAASSGVAHDARTKEEIDSSLRSQNIESSNVKKLSALVVDEFHSQNVQAAPPHQAAIAIDREASAKTRTTRSAIVCKVV